MDNSKVILVFTIIFIVVLVIISITSVVVSSIPIDIKDFFGDTQQVCSDFTIESVTDKGRMCIPDDNALIKYLLDNKYLITSKTNAKVAIGLDTKLIPLENWQIEWQNYGVNCNRTANFGWDPLLAGIGRIVKSQTGGDMCNQNTCYVNGLCVSPYETNASCCPGCAGIAVQDGGCAGKVLCDPNANCGQMTKVEYPGTVLTCAQDPIIAPPCSEGVTKGDCWSPNHVDEQRRVPYVTWNSTCTESSLCAMNDGKNEFECAIGCKGLSQRQCSRLCFPKMWKWYQVLKDNVPIGFWESEELMGVTDTPVKYCKDQGCVYSRDLGTNPEANMCSGCDSCNNISEFNGKIGNYFCNNCKKCKLNVKPADTGDCGDLGQEISCVNLNKCTGCQKNKYNFFGTISENTCGQCAISPNSCVFHTKNPFEVIGSSIKQRSTVTNYQESSDYINSPCTFMFNGQNICRKSFYIRSKLTGKYWVNKGKDGFYTDAFDKTKFIIDSSAGDIWIYDASTNNNLYYNSDDVSIYANIPPNNNVFWRIFNFKDEDKKYFMIQALYDYRYSWGSGSFTWGYRRPIYVKAPKYNDGGKLRSFDDNAPGFYDPEAAGKGHPNYYDHPEYDDSLWYFES
jgi:hypothetical protein